MVIYTMFDIQKVCVVNSLIPNLVNLKIVFTYTLNHFTKMYTTLL